jgi:hypothetical protein
VFEVSLGRDRLRCQDLNYRRGSARMAHRSDTYDNTLWLRDLI